MNLRAPHQTGDFLTTWVTIGLSRRTLFHIIIEPWQLSRIALGYGLDDRGFESRQNLELPLHHLVPTGSGTHPASYTMGTRYFSLRVKCPGREADHSPPSSVEVKNTWSYTYTTPIRLHSVVLS
jgi:hypothetical protein